jgi:hypothetical protein
MASRFTSKLGAGSLDRERDASPDRDDAFIASNRTTLPLNPDTSRADLATAHLAALSRQSTVLVRPPLVHLTGQGSAAKDRPRCRSSRPRARDPVFFMTELRGPAYGENSKF